ncbi:hypothetical protein [Desulfonema magnum]|uniref:Uncharacterized protein n=1 Tax=Desulfonema magnum TaxID=45655 RepID=A0A975BJD5_9BACT|nr:hypothetical protein [Desulfonema magnum]QTA86423.1 Uncharacterized protein dnm_024470 [Desulfonema magnum]
MSDYWKKQVFSHYDLLNRLVRKRFPDTNTADEAFIYLIDIIGNKRPDIRSAKLAVWRYSSSGVPNLQFGDDDVVPGFLRRRHTLPNCKFGTPDVRFRALMLISNKVYFERGIP